MPLTRIDPTPLSENEKKPECFITPANAHSRFPGTVLRLELFHTGRLRPFSALLFHEAHPLTFTQ
jgi:hypothetical protein